MTSEAFRQARLRAYANLNGLANLQKVGVAAGFAGILALLSQISIPVGWTPVPLTFQMLGIFLVGTYLGPRYALVSLGIYVLAGAVGLHVFAPSTDAYNPPQLWSADRWQVLIPNALAASGYTAGYIAGWFVSAWFVGWWIRRREAQLDGRSLAGTVLALVALLLGASIAASYLLGSGSYARAGGGANYQATYDALWWFLAAFAVVAAIVLLLLRRRQNAGEATKLFAVFMAATAITHVPGVVVLKLVLGWEWAHSWALGSTVFLPFDALKAGLAVLLSLPFLPSRAERAQLEQST